MKSNRKAAEAFILKYLGKAFPGTGNVEMYKARFESMSDKDFEAWVTALGKGEETIAITVPNWSKSPIDIDNVIAVTNELGYDFFQHVTLTNPETGLTYRTPAKHMVLDLPLRRQVQMLSKKMGVPTSNRSVDERTGQPTGDSKGTSFTYPEIQVNAAKRLPNMITELIKMRGGDDKAFNASNRAIYETGDVSMDAITNQIGNTNTGATEVMEVLLKSMMLDNNLASNRDIQQP